MTESAKFGAIRSYAVRLADALREFDWTTLRHTQRGQTIPHPSLCLRAASLVIHEKNTRYRRRRL
jgi:hypothetical protein